MDFKTCIEEERAKKIPADIMRARSMIKSSDQAILTAKSISLQETSLKTVLRELYEGLRECCEAIGYLEGYKMMDHSSITYFLRDVLKEEALSRKFDRYRKLRNGINYYGNDINVETVEEALDDVPKIINHLKKRIKSM